jgi:hypothetical protein
VPAQALGLASLVAAACLALSEVLEALVGPGGLGATLRLLAMATLPGLFVVQLGTRDEDDAARGLVRALALSPVVFVGGSLAASAGLGASLATSGWLCVAVAAAGAVGLSLARGVELGREVPFRWLASRGPWLFVAPSIALCAAALVVWSTPGARVSYHGVLHAGFVAQLVEGTIPPENPALAGVPAGFYWLYHWLLASWGELARVSILETSVALNLLALAVYVSGSVLLLRRFLQPRAAAWGGLACGFAVNLLVPLVFAARCALEGAPGTSYVWPFEFLRTAWLGGDPRLVTLLAKFLNVNGFPLGLGLFALLLDELAPRASGRPRLWFVVLLLVGLGLFHPTTAAGAYAALGGAIAIGALAELSRDGFSSLWQRTWPVALAFGVALALTAPYLLSVASAAPELVHGLRGAEIDYAVRGLGLTATPLLVAVLWGARRGWRDPFARFLLTSTLILLILGALLPLPDGNQYKLVLMASLPGGALLLWRLGEPAGRPVARWLFASTVALALGTHLVTLVAYQRSAMVERTLYAGEVGYLSLPGDPVLDRALHWLRDSTPRDAVVISRPVRFGGALVTPVSGRSDFVMLGGHHTQGDSRFRHRIELVRRLLDPQEPVAPLLGELRAELDRPLYLLVRRDQLPNSFGALVERFEGAAQTTRVYDDQDLRIYAFDRVP